MILKFNSISSMKANKILLSDVIRVVEKLSIRYPYRYDFGESSFEEIIFGMEKFRKKNGDKVNYSKLVNRLKDLETGKMVAGANIGIKRTIELINVHRIE